MNETIKAKHIEKQSNKVCVVFAIFSFKKISNLQRPFGCKIFEAM
jgi:hypothetical protein